jgi:BclA C-terminal domain
LRACGSYSNDAGSIVAVVLGGTSIPLSSATASLNISYSGTTATIANAGVYRMSYCIRTTSSVSMSSRLRVNGAGVTSSAISPPQGSDKFCRATTLSLAAATTVDLQLYADPPVAATLLSPGGAEMLIEQPGDL